MPLPIRVFGRNGTFAADRVTRTVAYSMRRIRTGYTGPAVRIRRSSDSAESDFTPEQIQNGAMASWVGSGNDGFIRTWYDHSGNGLHAEQTTASLQPKIDTSQSKHGVASVLFDGTDDRLEAGGQSGFAFGSGDFTVEVWVRMTAVDAVEQIFDFREVGDGPGLGASRINLALEGSTNRQAVWYILNAIRIRGTTNFATSTWYHIAVCRSGTNTRLFINGTQEGATWTDNTNYTVGAGRPFFGSNGESPGNQVAGQPFSGYMDEIRMTKGTALYTSNFLPPID